MQVWPQLVEFFFAEEVLARSFAFGTRLVPEDKDILNHAIISAI